MNKTTYVNAFEIIKKILQANANLKYTVQGSRSYLAKIPLKTLQTLQKVLPDYFAPGDWNICADHKSSDILTKLIIREFETKKIPLELRNTSNKDIRRLTFITNNVQVATIIDISRSKYDIPAENCKTKKPHVQGKIKYSSYCDVKEKIDKGLKSDTFSQAKKEKLRIIQQVLNNTTMKDNKMKK